MTASFLSNLLQVSQWYELVVFTASMEIYGSAVADKLDNSRSILKRRYYRQVRDWFPGWEVGGRVDVRHTVLYFSALHFGVGQLHQRPLCGPQ